MRSTVVSKLFDETLQLIRENVQQKGLEKKCTVAAANCLETVGRILTDNGPSHRASDTSIDITTVWNSLGLASERMTTGHYKYMTCKPEHSDIINNCQTTLS
jgi:hypothetical protein